HAVNTRNSRLRAIAGSSKLKLAGVLAIACGLGLGLPIFAQRRTGPDPNGRPGVRVAAGAPQQRSIAQLMEDQASRGGVRVRPIKPELENEARRIIPQNPASPLLSQWPPAPVGEVRPQGIRRVLSPQTLGVAFDGATGPTETGAFPPDTDGEIG